MEHDPDLADAQSAFKRGDLARARAIAEARLAREPNLPLLQHLLGLIHCRQGNMNVGIDCLRRSADGEPTNVAYRVMLARALTDSGRAKEALEIAARPGGASPPELALWHARAEAAATIQDWQQSAEAWGKLCAAGASDWRGWTNYGRALASLGRWAQASGAFKRALQLNPQETSLRRSLATVLARAGKYDESADELGRWVNAVPDNPEVRITFARLLADLGRDAEAMAQLDRAAELTTGAPADLESTSSLMAIAIRGDRGSVDVSTLKELARLLERINRMDTLDDLLGEAEELGVSRERIGYPAASIAFRQGNPSEARRLLLTESPEGDPVRWHRLMARTADALGDVQTAFTEADAMNRSVNDYETWRGRAAQYLTWTCSLGETITQEWAGSLHTLEPSDRRSPAFLVGFPRSGTTLLDTYLMGHGGTAVLEEQPMISAVETALGDVAQLALRSKSDLEAARSAYFAELDRHTELEFDEMVIDKLPLNMLAVPFLHSLFPNARFIFAQRHPCDVVLSCYMQGFALSNAMACFLDLESAAAFYDAAMRVWTASCAAFPIKVHILTYERLVAAPEPELRPLIDFIGLEWRPGLLDHRATAQARGAIGTPSYDQVIRPLDRAPTGRWRRYERQLEPVLPVLLPWAERLGYRD